MLLFSDVIKLLYFTKNFIFLNISSLIRFLDFIQLKKLVLFQDVDDFCSRIIFHLRSGFLFL